MEQLEYINWLFYAIMGGFGYMLKRELNTKDEQIKVLNDAVTEIRRDYLHRDDFKEFKQELRDMFIDIKEDIRSLKARSEKS